jgi:hypothetical protein
MGVGRGANNPTLLRSLQEIQPDFVEEGKAQAGLWSQGKKKEDPSMSMSTEWSFLFRFSFQCKHKSTI